jgi:hypothetical protein
MIPKSGGQFSDKIMLKSQKIIKGMTQSGMLGTTNRARAIRGARERRRR